METNIESALVNSARSWLRTRWMHNSQLKGTGVDCIRFLQAIAQDVGISLELPRNYARVAEDNGIMNFLDDHFERCNGIKKGRILLFACRGLNSHVGLATEQTMMIHASFSHKKVIEHQIDGIWFRLLRGIWKVTAEQESNWRNYGRSNMGSVSH